jgi:hypothetical protein
MEEVHIKGSMPIPASRYGIYTFVFSNDYSPKALRARSRANPPVPCIIGMDAKDTPGVGHHSAVPAVAARHLSDPSSDRHHPSVLSTSASASAAESPTNEHEARAPSSTGHGTSSPPSVPSLAVMSSSSPSISSVLMGASRFVGSRLQEAVYKGRERSLTWLRPSERTSDSQDKVIHYTIGMTS